MKQMTSSTAAAGCHYDTCRCAARQSGFRKRSCSNKS